MPGAVRRAPRRRSARGCDELRLVQDPRSAPVGLAPHHLRPRAGAVLSASMAASHDGVLTARALADVETPALLALVWRPARSPAVRAFLAHAGRAFSAS
ncbi:hypothetical protein ABZ869_24755 [Streptomyces sp. NPDC046928]|uniref:hypothetical protein n=1 Tax=Streptomyces sp. NPDC046928 TaxID=3155021 RepID=UPI0033EB0432